MGYLLFVLIIVIACVHITIAQAIRDDIRRFGLRVWHIVVMVMFFPFTIISWISFKVAPILNKPVGGNKRGKH
jgi:uncharacterized transporter YbjL